MVKIVSEVGVFFRGHRFPPPIKLNATIDILLKVALNTITLTIVYAEQHYIGAYELLNILVLYQQMVISSYNDLMMPDLPFEYCASYLAPQTVEINRRSA
jgi:hypothetical protein